MTKTPDHRLIVRTAFVTALILAVLGPAAAPAAADGELTQRPDAAGCSATGRSMSRPSSLAVSPDGKNAYATTLVALSGFGNTYGVAVFDRSSDGALTQRAGADGCMSQDPVAGCTDGHGLDGARDVAVSPDGTSVYVATLAGSSVAVFDRAADGSLTQKAGAAGCFSASGADGCATARGLAGGALS